MSNCSHQSPNVETPAIELPDVSVNGEFIAADQIAREVQHHPSSSPEEGIQKATEALIIQKLLLQRAVSLGLGSPEQRNGDASAEETCIARLVEQEASAPNASEEDCLRYFQSNRDKFTSPDLLEVKHILLAADPKDHEQLDKAKNSAKALIKTLTDAPKSFSELAKGHSSCPSKNTGGNLGQLTKGQTTPEFERQVFPLNEGLARTPIETRYGYHVVFVERKIPGKPLEFSMVKDKILQYLNEASQRKAIGQYLQILISEAEITGIDIDSSPSPLLQ